MKRIIILNSYNLTGRNPYDFVRIKYFLKGLRTEGYIKDKDFLVELIDSNDLTFLESALKIEGRKGADLIHAVGTPNAAIAAKFTKDIPIVYYGAHPEDVGAMECQTYNSCGVILTLPFTCNYKNFRFVKKILPDLQNVYVPFYEKTIFCPEIVKKKYRTFRSKDNDPAWVEMESDYIGYRSLAGLCYITGVNYFEFVYRNIEELSAVLGLMNPESSLIMTYNDSIYCSLSPEVICKSSLKKGIPLIWNNNPEATQIGALAAIAGCFKEAGYVTGIMAGKIFKGIHPSDIGYQMSTHSYASINLKTAKNFDLEFPREVLDYFDEIIA